MKANFSGLSSKFLGRMFRKIDGLVWDLSTGKLGIQDVNGIYTLETTEGTPASGSGENKVAAVPAGYGISVNPLESFGIPIPAFATQVPHDKLAPGDLVVGDKGILGWIVAKKPASLVLLDKNGMEKQYNPPKVAIMGGEGVLVVQSLGGLAGAGGFGNLQGSLLPLLMMGGDLDLDSILPMMLMSQTTGGGQSSLTAMLPMLLMMGNKGGNGGSAIDKLLPLMLMGGMGGGAAGAGGMNPMMMAMMMGGGLGDDSLPSTFASDAAPVLRPIKAAGPAPLRPLHR